MTTFTRFDQNRILAPACIVWFYHAIYPYFLPPACVMVLLGKMNWLAMVRIIERAVGNTVF